MANGNGNGNGHHNNGDQYSNYNLLNDEDLADHFEKLISAAHVKGLSDEEIGYGLMAASTEFMLDQGHAECCVMQMLVDFMATYYDYWHDAMSMEGDDPEGEV